MSCLKNSNIYIKFYIKTAPTCFGVTVTPSSGSALIRAYYLNPLVTNFTFCVHVK